MEMLLQKEKQLEVAAKIGIELLQLNDNLRARNEFLESALHASTDSIVQLRHELQLRSNLLHICADYDNDSEAPTSRHASAVTNFYKAQTTCGFLTSTKNLKKSFVEQEERERSNIDEWMKQLDAANEKVDSLQRKLKEKSDECATQNVEVDRLLREVTLRNSREKTLVIDNADLHDQLQRAAIVHEELELQMMELQERYTEVVCSLRDAEEELGTYRQKQSAYRSRFWFYYICV
ncbi:unnamed protein product [Gongylonema pulchrum]|uniref:HAP1 N-terminal domain-containing protein n=1 Tax=Gongylonema pulchrum TaxID=637853 RepID=A0A183EDI1_9BILA|nr:unnamed protein product [Gongylonema pulchrum]